MMGATRTGKRGQTHRQVAGALISSTLWLGAPATVSATTWHPETEPKFFTHGTCERQWLLLKAMKFCSGLFCSNRNWTVLPDCFKYTGIFCNKMLLKSKKTSTATLGFLHVGGCGRYVNAVLTRSLSKLRSHYRLIDKTRHCYHFSFITSKQRKLENVSSLGKGTGTHSRAVSTSEITCSSLSHSVPRLPQICSGPWQVPELAPPQQVLLFLQLRPQVLYFPS